MGLSNLLIGWSDGLHLKGILIDHVSFSSSLEYLQWGRAHIEINLTILIYFTKTIRQGQLSKAWFWRKRSSWWGSFAGAEWRGRWAILAAVTQPYVFSECQVVAGSSVASTHEGFVRLLRGSAQGSGGKSKPLNVNGPHYTGPLGKFCCNKRPHSQINQ